VFVIDASVALAWCFADESSAYADAVLDRLMIEEARVPAIWPFEVSNGLCSAERRGRIRRGEIPRVRELLLALPVVVDDADLGEILGGVLEMARTLDLSSYDASYVALAAREDLPFATADDRLRTAARKAPVELIE